MSWLVVGAAVAWHLGRWAASSVARLPLKVLAFPFRSPTGLGLGLLIAGGTAYALFGPLVGVPPQQRFATAGAGVFATALVMQWRALARKPGKLPAWLRFLLGWAAIAAACWLVVPPALAHGIGLLLRLDSLAILLLGLVVAALVLASGRLAGELRRIWRLESGHRRDQRLLERLRVTSQPPATSSYAEWYAWACSELGADAAEDAADAAVAVLARGGTGAAAAARGAAGGPRRALAGFRTRWSEALAVAAS